MEILVGTCGFPILRRRYFSEFNVVELNNTFYSIPKESWLIKVRSEAPEEFEFTFKAFQGITHNVSSPTWKKSKIKDYRKLKGKVGYLRTTPEVLELWSKQLEIAKILNSKIIVIQLPASFKDTDENIKNARKFFESIERSKIDIAIELRGWSKDRIRELCLDYDLIDVTDPLIREPLSEKDILYFRLHGRIDRERIVYRYKYSKEELLKIKEILDELSPKKAYIMFNNVYMYENSKEFKAIVDSGI